MNYIFFIQKIINFNFQYKLFKFFLFFIIKKKDFRTFLKYKFLFFFLKLIISKKYLNIFKKKILNLIGIKIYFNL
jgi:hypothetical protein